MTLTISPEARVVRRGCDLLDERLPGWAEKIDLRTLRIQAPSCCVVGQLYGDYSDGLGRLGLRGDDIYAYGFTQNTQLGVTSWVNLNAEWQEQIKARKFKPSIPAREIDLATAGD